MGQEYYRNRFSGFLCAVTKNAESG